MSRIILTAVVVEEHKVNTAGGSGFTADDLAEFNWQTSDADRVHHYMKHKLV